MLRLPVKSLVRFKCVCKSWLSLISNPHFAKSHFELSATPSNRVLCVASSGSEALSIDVDASLHDDSALVSLVSPRPQPGEPVAIFGSCRGFLLLGRDENPNLYLWNPSTGFHKQLSCPEIVRKKYIYPQPYLIGFGYDPSTDDYLVVVLCQDDSVFFSFRTNSWKKFNTPFQHRLYQYRVIYTRSGLFFNGAIHWLAHSPIKIKHVLVNVIIVFDLIEKNLSQISLPRSYFSDRVFRHRLCIMGGCLTLCCWDVDSTYVWMMKEYKVESSWTLFVIHNRKISPLCFAKGGELVAFSCHSELKFHDKGKFLELMKFNDEGNSLELMKFKDKGNFLENGKYSYDIYPCMAAMHTESLLSLPSDCGVSMKTPPTETNQKNCEAGEIVQS
ncbi:F-box/kelch-repeat protein At3g23880-like [Gastrolobium bilobum]|uniref:F-box/kelch-repeat protein At3g23880-like n=1 Tax=Gastrolobium bilobum TaxID=150636 RepID=UPI002AB21D29|nr:F-box/kelch-repeat protein At3g23880-like [Gastrolobium bilobum]